MWTCRSRWVRIFLSTRSAKAGLSRVERAANDSPVPELSVMGAGLLNFGPDDLSFNLAMTADFHCLKGSSTSTSQSTRLQI